MALYIDNEPFNWKWVSDAVKKEFAQAHTWTVAPHKIKFDFSKKKLVAPNVGHPSEYRAFFSYGEEPNPIKQMHHVVYSTGKQPHPTRQGANINLPIQIMLGEDGYLQDVRDQDLNFFFTNSPYLEGGKNYTNAKKIINLYSRKKIAQKAETEADRIGRVIKRISEMKGNEVVAQARAILSQSKVKERYFQVNDNIVAQKEGQEYNDEISILKNGILKFAISNSEHYMSIVASDESKAYLLIEKLQAKEKLSLNQDSPKQGTQGTWQVRINEGWEDVCDTTITEPAMSTLITFLSDKKNAKQLTMLETANKQTAVPA